MEKLCYGLLVVCGRLPGRRWVGMGLGRLAFFFMHKRRRVAAQNIKAAFPALSDVAQTTLLHKHFAVLGMSFMDTLWGLSASREDVCQFVRIEGEVQSPCLLLAPHFLGFDLGLLRLGCFSGIRSVSYYYKPLHNIFWSKTINRLRQRFGAHGFSTASRYSLLASVRRLRADGEVLCYMPDIDPKLRKSTVFVPFLGVPRTATTLALSRLAKALKVPVVPIIVCREGDGYVLRLLPPIADFPAAAGGYADAKRMNEVIGEWVEKQPENYFWLHRRFKTVAAQDTSVYD